MHTYWICSTCFRYAPATQLWRGRWYVMSGTVEAKRIITHWMWSIGVLRSRMVSHWKMNGAQKSQYLEEDHVGANLCLKLTIIRSILFPWILPVNTNMKGFTLHIIYSEKFFFQCLCCRWWSALCHRRSRGWFYGKTRFPYIKALTKAWVKCAVHVRMKMVMIPSLPLED